MRRSGESTAPDSILSACLIHLYWRPTFFTGNKMAFELSQAVPADVDDMMYIVSAGWKDDGIWKYMMLDVTPEDEHAYLIEFFGYWFKLPNRVFYKITEVATG